MKFEVESKKIEYYNLRRREDNKPVLVYGELLGLEFNTDTQETEVAVDVVKYA